MLHACASTSIYSYSCHIGLPVTSVEKAGCGERNKIGRVFLKNACALWRQLWKLGWMGKGGSRVSESTPGAANVDLIESALH
jgi:hypothetical protein